MLWREHLQLGVKRLYLVNGQVCWHLFAENQNDAVDQQVHRPAVLLEVSGPQLAIHQLLNEEIAELDVVVFVHAVKLVHTRVGRGDFHLSERAGQIIGRHNGEAIALYLSDESGEKGKEEIFDQNFPCCERFLAQFVSRVESPSLVVLVEIVAVDVQDRAYHVEPLLEVPANRSQGSLG